MNGGAGLTSRATAFALSGVLLLGGVNGALAKKGQSKWPIAMGEVTKVAGATQIVEIKDANGTTLAFKVIPQTEIEQERERPVKFIWSVEFADLKVGQWVRVKYYGNGDPKIARDIDIYLTAPTQ